MDKKARHEMHFGNLETSKRLQETLAALQNGKVNTTNQVRRATRSQAVHSDIAALRKNGIVIETVFLGRRRGRRIYGYQLAQETADVCR